MKIRIKLIIAFMSVGLIPMLIVGLMSYNKSSDNIEKWAYAELSVIRDAKKDAVEQYINQCLSQARTFSASMMVGDAAHYFDSAVDTLVSDGVKDADLKRMVSELGQFYREEYGQKYIKENGKEANVDALLSSLDPIGVQMQHAYIFENSNPLGSKHELDYAQDKSVYSVYHRDYHPIMRQYLEEYGYYDIFIVNPEGLVIYSVFKELDYMASLTTGAYANTNFAGVFKQALEAGKAGDGHAVFLSDFASYTPSYEAPASFAASPIVREGKCVGVAVMQMPLSLLNKIVTDTKGLGETGQSYLVGSDYLFRTDSRFEENKTAVASFKNPDAGRHESEALRKGLAGEAGVMHEDNYAGEDALTAFGPVYVGENTWAIVSEMTSREAFATTRGLLWFKFAMVGVAFLVILAVAAFISKRLSSPIRGMADTLNDIAQGEGDLTKRLEVKSKDEIGDAATAFNIFMDKLQSIIGEVAENAKVMESASNQLEGSAASMADNATGMNGQISNVAAAGEELSVNVQSMSEAAEQISGSAKSVSMAIDELTSSISEVSKNCIYEAQIAEKANVQARRTSEDIQELGKSAEEIESVLDLIRNVADQTNLLALNASIEAASAGEAGKGFAVVANEVKELAQQTTMATQDIEAKIGQIRSRIGVSIDGISEVTKVIEEVNKISDSISETIEKQSSTTGDISRTIRDVTDSTVMLAQNVEESAQGASEVSKNMYGINESAKAATEGANDTDRNSKELAETTAQLNGIVGQFKY